MPIKFKYTRFTYNAAAMLVLMIIGSLFSMHGMFNATIRMESSIYSFAYFGLMTLCLVQNSKYAFYYGQNLIVAFKVKEATTSLNKVIESEFLMEFAKDGFQPAKMKKLAEKHSKQVNKFLTDFGRYVEPRK